MDHRDPSCCNWPSRTELLNSLPHHPLLTAAQPSLGYAFYDMAVLVLTLITDATNLNKIQMHRPMNTMFLDLPVSLLLLCVQKMHMKLAKSTNFKILCIKLTFWRQNLWFVDHYMNLCHMLMKVFKMCHVMYKTFLYGGEIQCMTQFKYLTS